MRGETAAARVLICLRRPGGRDDRSATLARDVTAAACSVSTMLAVFTGMAVSGCSPDALTPAPPLASSVAGAPRAVELPIPEVLARLLDRLADPEVRGDDKLMLLEGAAARDSAIVDRFIAALHDNDYLPLTFTPTDIAWSDRVPGNVVATVEIKTAKKDSREFFLPLEFNPTPPSYGTWQLSRRSAEMLLEFGGPTSSAQSTSEAASSMAPGGAPISQATGATPAP